MSSPAPKRRLDVRQATTSGDGGKRAARRRRGGAHPLLPTPAMAGAFALVLAGFCSTVIGSGVDSNTLAADNYQTISQSYTGPDQGSEGTEVDVSRDFDRSLIEEQAKAQAAQREIALKNLAEKVSSEADRQKKNQWVLPVTGYHLTARFGQRSGLWSTTHTGLDFAGPTGSTIVSVAAGTVTSVGYEGAYGNRTIVRLDDGTDIWYCHQSRMAVSVGQRVDPGDIIGYTGSTGNVTGPHLHLEVHPGGGNPINPEAALISHGVRP